MEWMDTWEGNLVLRPHRVAGGGVRARRAPPPLETRQAPGWAGAQRAAHLVGNSSAGLAVAGAPAGGGRQPDAFLREERQLN